MQNKIQNVSNKSIRLAVVAALAGAAFAASATSARAALIQPAPTVPVSMPVSPFDVSNSGVAYALSPTTNLLPNGFDNRDLFGGSFGTNGYEARDAIFLDQQPQGTVDSVTVTLPSAVTLTSFDFYLEDDGTSGARSASDFQLYAGATLLDDVTLLDNTGTQSYDSVYGSNYIHISDTISNAPVSNVYTLDFTQNQSASDTSGVRAMEFAVNVPEPVIGLPMMLAALALRKSRRSK